MFLSKEAVCVNLTSTISDHFPQIFFIPSMFSDNPVKSSCKNFNRVESVIDYFDKD